MGHKVQARKDMSAFGALLAKHKLKPEDPFLFFNDVMDFAVPYVVRTDESILAANIAKIIEGVAGLAEGTEIDISDIMKAEGLDSHIKSDAFHVRQALKESGLLQYTKGEPERWVRRLTKGNGQ